jgi:hypothetical protein
MFKIERDNFMNQSFKIQKIISKVFHVFHVRNRKITNNTIIALKIMRINSMKYNKYTIPILFIN